MTESKKRKHQTTIEDLPTDNVELICSFVKKRNFLLIGQVWREDDEGEQIVQQKLVHVSSISEVPSQLKLLEAHCDDIRLQHFDNYYDTSLLNLDENPDATCIDRFFSNSICVNYTDVPPYLISFDEKDQLVLDRWLKGDT